MARRLRVLHILVQPVLGWDDGEEITTGPPIQPQTLAPTQVRAMLDGLAAEVARIEAEAAGPPD